MTRLQKFFSKILPVAWAKNMEAESRQWMVRCPCGYEKSVWELGGIRWKARGNPHQLRQCPQCGQRTWHTITRQTSP